MKKKTRQVIGTTYLLLVIFNGIIASFCKLFHLNIGLSPINSIILIMLPVLAIVFWGNKKNKDKFDSYIGFLIKTFLFVIVIKLFFLIASSNLGATDIMDYLIYICGSFTAYYYYINYIGSTEKLFVIIRNSFFAIGIIYFTQLFFHSNLPVAFTEVPNLFREYGVETYTRELVDIVVYRPNGLIGDPITLGYYLNIVFSIELYYYNQYKDKKMLIKLGIIFLMIVFLFSRANILFVTGMVILNFILRNGVVKSFLYFLSGVILGTIMLYYLYSYNPYITFLIDRFSGADTYAAASTDEHSRDYMQAINTIIENPVLGISPKERIENSIITDGAIFILLLDFGISGFVVLMVMYLLLVLRVRRDFLKERVWAPQFLFLILLIPYSVLNSAVLNKGMLILTCIYFGILSCGTSKLIEHEAAV